MTRSSRILFTAVLAACPGFNGRSNIRSLLLIGAVLSWLAAPAFAAPPDRVEICHIPPDTPDNVQTIVVGPMAAEQHFVEHGDFEVGLECFEGIGECEDDGVTICVAGDDTCSATPDDPPEPTEVSCADGLDNDCDGFVDAEDPDCTVECPCAQTWENGIAAPDIGTALLTNCTITFNPILLRLDAFPAAYQQSNIAVAGGTCGDTDNSIVDITAFDEHFTPSEFAACESYLLSVGCNGG